MKKQIASVLRHSFNGKRDMTDCYLIAQDLSGLDLSKAILDNAELDCATLSQTNLTETSLKQTSFFSADLEGANLSYAKLDNCNFRHANLEGADLTGVDFTSSNVRDAIFTDVKGLSFRQKRWLKNNGALNIDFNEKEEKLLNYQSQNHGLFNKIRSLIPLPY